MKNTEVYKHLREIVTDDTWHKVESIMSYFGTYWEDLNSYRNQAVREMKYIHIRYARVLIVYYLHLEHNVPFKMLACTFSPCYRSFCNLQPIVKTMFTRHLFIERFYNELKK
jgi:hypothetical protein